MSGDVIEVGNVWGVFVTECLNGGFHQCPWLRRQEADGAALISMDP